MFIVRFFSLSIYICIAIEVRVMVMVFNVTFQQYLSYIVAVSSIGGENRSGWSNPPTWVYY